jgi:tRNA U34 5-methylaminomethyl-2-thiouridine-forming methyltransferase MnmC
MNELILTSDGSHSIFSDRYGVSYHSRYGAVQETQHVFIESALLFRAGVLSELSVLEIGFGTGLNAFMTYLEALKQSLRISYTTIEAFPLEMETVRQLNYPAVLKAPGEEAVFHQMHEGPWGKEMELHAQFSFRKEQLNFEEIDYHDQFDVIYFDAFAPNAQPELWEIPVLQKMYAALRPGGVLTTYCAKGSVKRNFRSLGFEVTSLPGPPGKREMTRCQKPLHP